MANDTGVEHKTGKVVQIIGPVLDVEFPDHLPAIYNALHIKSSESGVEIDVIAEVEQHLGENRVRAVAMKPTDGMQRGMAAVDLGEPISVPVGPEVLGRVLNVLGEPVDSSQVMVVGDTPLDVEAAHAAGAVALGVATGHFSRDDLQKAGADHLLNSLAEPMPF